MTGLWAWMIYRNGSSGFVDLIGSRGLVGRDLRFLTTVRPGERKWTLASAYAALIAAISGPMPMMFMTRLRL